MALSVENIFSKDVTEDIIYPDIADEFERTRRISLWKTRAKVLRLETEAKAIINADAKNDKQLAAEGNKRSAVCNYEYLTLELEKDQYGKPKSTIQNFVNILLEFEDFKNKIFLNEMTQRPEIMSANNVTEWTDTDKANAMNIIEQFFGIYSEQKFDKAFAIVCEQRKYNPLKLRMNNILWDGKERIEHFLHYVFNCEDNTYTREVSRLIFAGGIHRLYNSGCKFDSVPILIGTQQGEGKSTVVRWLAMLEEYSCSVKTIDGKNGIEEINGKWICELDELIAVTRAKEVEAVKSFISRVSDRYRMSYDKFVRDIPRKCIFIGTTNKAQCLTDPTGNRRFLPVTVHSSGYDIFNREDEIKEYIAQCWGEAKAKYDAGKLPPFPSRELEPTFKQMQTIATEEDPRVGLIEDFLVDKSEVCNLQLWHGALNKSDFEEMTKRDGAAISVIMQNMKGWERAPERKYFSEFKQQRYWRRVNESNKIPDFEF